MRYYFRKRRGKRTPLLGLPGSDAFMAAYAKALSEVHKPKAAFHPRSFSALYARYLASPNFKKLKPSSQYCTRNTMDRIIAKHGKGLVTQMTREHVDKIIGAMAETPAAANTWLKRIRTLVNYSIALGWRQTDPTKGVNKFQEGEYHTWDDSELAAYEARWPLGTRERTAYALALYTGQRRSDIFRMTWADVGGGYVKVVQAKTGTKLEIPIHPDLAEALDEWPKKHLTIITSTKESQYSVESFGNLMADAIGKADLPKRCVLHGLRKAATRRLAESGCSANQIASITGHKSLEEVERYTRAASQKKMAGDAILKLPSRVGTNGNKP